ncbi:MAG TPA: dienelactone hydrolase family protein [Acidimicrobiia bacterium]|nr:dienelactone hydrolase family protein [Acidimicrobiia bacterium]
MCVAADAQPPIPSSGNASTRGMVLVAADGTPFNAFEALATDTPSKAAVVVLPDVRGLFPFYEGLAARLAEAGYDSIAIDYFGRTAGTDPRGPDFEFGDHVARTHSEGINADIAAAIGHLRERRPEVAIFTVGFCFGGTCSWAATTHGHGLAGAVGFYGRPDIDRPAGDGPFLERCDRVTAPILALMGGNDPSIPAETIADLEGALSGAGVEHAVITYPGAPHSFFDRRQSDFVEESKDAWRRVLAFIDEHS